MNNSGGIVVMVSSNSAHSVAKVNRRQIQLLAGLGVEGDIQQGKTAKHRWIAARDPKQANLRQVHLIHAELHEELQKTGFFIAAGQMGENITTRGIDLLALPHGTKLTLGKAAVVEITGFRIPCSQLDGLQPGLMQAVLGRDEDGNPTSKAGIMSVVLSGGEVKPGDSIAVELPSRPHHRLESV